jgi:hypothetical protein
LRELWLARNDLGFRVWHLELSFNVRTPRGRRVQAPRHHADRLLPVAAQRSLLALVRGADVMSTIEIIVGRTRLIRDYAPDDSIWSLPEEKRERQALADAQRDLAMGADRLAQTPYAVRG